MRTRDGGGKAHGGSSFPKAVLGTLGSEAGTLPVLHRLLALPWEQKASSDSKGCPSGLALKMAEVKPGYRISSGVQPRSLPVTTGPHSWALALFLLGTQTIL